MRKKMYFVALATVALCLVAGPAAAHTSAAPTLGNFTPKQGPSGSKVTIVGTNLGGAQVSFNQIPASSITVNRYGTALVATVPKDTFSGGTTVAQLTVTTPGGTVTAAGGFRITGIAVNKVTPHIVSFMPLKGSAGTKVTISGANLGVAQSVKLGRTTMFFKIVRDKIVAMVPKNAHSGALSVKTPGGVAVAALHFKVTGGMNR
jgi:hypothetical protein